MSQVEPAGNHRRATKHPRYLPFLFAMFITQSFIFMIKCFWTKMLSVLQKVFWTRGRKQKKCYHEAYTVLWQKCHAQHILLQSLMTHAFMQAGNRRMLNHSWDYLFYSIILSSCIFLLFHFRMSLFGILAKSTITLHSV